MNKITNKQEFQDFCLKIIQISRHTEYNKETSVFKHLRLTNQQKLDLLKQITPENINEPKSIIALVLGATISNKDGEEIGFIFDKLEAEFDRQNTDKTL